MSEMNRFQNVCHPLIEIVNHNCSMHHCKIKYLVRFLSKMIIGSTFHLHLWEQLSLLVRIPLRIPEKPSTRTERGRRRVLPADGFLPRKDDLLHARHSLRNDRHHYRLLLHRRTSPSQRIRISGYVIRRHRLLRHLSWRWIAFRIVVCRISVGFRIFDQRHELHRHDDGRILPQRQLVSDLHFLVEIHFMVISLF